MAPLLLPILELRSQAATLGLGIATRVGRLPSTNGKGLAIRWAIGRWIAKAPKIFFSYQLMYVISMGVGRQKIRVYK